jgi:hypothetical protein
MNDKEYHAWRAVPEAFSADWAVLVGAAWYLVPRWALLWVLFVIVFFIVATENTAWSETQ